MQSLIATLFVAVVISTTGAVSGASALDSGFIDWKELDRQGHGSFIDWKELDRQGHGEFIDWKELDRQGRGQ